MSDPVTPNIALAVPVHGTDVDTWDQPLNSDFGIIDSVAGGITSKSLSSSNVVLTATEAQAGFLRFSGALLAPVTITLPAIYKSWFVQNTTTGAFVVTLAGASGNVVGLPPGIIQVQWDGSNVQFLNLPHFIGEEWLYVGASVPAWVTACTVPPYLLEDGSTFSAGTYPTLNSILGGTTLPDARGRNRSNLNGGTARITGAGSGIDGDTRLSAGGSQNQTLVIANLPNGGTIGTVPVYDTPLAVGFGLGANFANYVDAAVGRTSKPVTSAGSGTPLTTMPPTYIGGITMIRAA